jgi:hypothetical protein
MCFGGKAAIVKLQAKEEGLFMEKLFATLDFLLGCHHFHLSRVFTIDGRTYRVCCDCGAKFKYSLERMRTEQRFGESSMAPFTTKLGQEGLALPTEL